LSTGGRYVKRAMAFVFEMSAELKLGAVLMLVAPVVPIGASLLAVGGSHLGYYGSEAIIPLAAAIGVAILTILSFWCIRALRAERAAFNAANDALQDSEGPLAQVFAAYGLGFIDHDPIAVTTTFSPQLEKILGMDRGRLDLETWRGSLLPEGPVGSVDQVHHEIAQGLAEGPRDVRVRRTDGEVRELHGMRRYIYAETGEVRRIIATFQDVTEQNRDRAARDGLARALDLSPCMVRSLDGVIEYWPRGCEALYGWSATEALGRRAQDLLKIRFPQPYEEIVATLRRDGEWTGELFKETRDGADRCIAAHWVLDNRGSDLPPRIVESVTDFTDLKDAAEALRESEARLAQAVAAYELGIFDYDAKTGIARFSIEMARITGYEQSALDELHLQDIVPPEDMERLARSALEVVRLRQERSSEKFRIVRADGKVRYLDGITHYQYKSDGELSRAIGIYKDVTAQVADQEELKARAARLQTLQAELTHVSRLSAMGEMAAALAHELNQPLTAVGASVGAIGMLMAGDAPIEGPMRQRILRAATQAEGQAVRAGEIVRRLRQFIVRGEVDTQIEDVESLIDDALALALPNPAVNNVNVRRSGSARRALVLADRVQIQQILVNLIRNAVEAMAAQTTPRVLTLTVEVQDEAAVVCVADTGPGIAAEVAGRLFTPFASTKLDGMGVGLSICRRIAESHGGTLWLEQTDAPGASFSFTLPLAQDGDLE
jgi:two-component system sensor kinase FixL